MELVQIGAEAVLTKEDNKLIKYRVSKGYRLKEIDEKLRKFRTRRESKILEKLSFVPKVFSSDDKDMKIIMEFINGNLVKNVLDELTEKERREICEKIGEQIGEMHDLGIIHGDLTTSNMIIRQPSLEQPFKKAFAKKVGGETDIKEKEIVFIDFGLGFFSKKIEDKATDLRLLRQALESKHYTVFEKSYKAVLNGYKKSENSKEVLKWLEEKVEKRGRYKRKV
ncbi:Kae1-associated serine/threonine protein kinase [Candidatus Woesearchaeota archaeon]|nr:Kae1-associated serine/threonine protein kinase [Candidatus Woesearchaeota archaeon]